MSACLLSTSSRRPPSSSFATSSPRLLQLDRGRDELVVSGAAGKAHEVAAGRHERRVVDEHANEGGHRARPGRSTERRVDTLGQLGPRCDSRRFRAARSRTAPCARARGRLLDEHRHHRREAVHSRAVQLEVLLLLDEREHRAHAGGGDVAAWTPRPMSVRPRQSPRSAARPPARLGSGASRCSRGTSARPARAPRSCGRGRRPPWPSAPTTGSMRLDLGTHFGGHLFEGQARERIRRATACSCRRSRRAPMRRCRSPRGARTSRPRGRAWARRRARARSGRPCSRLPAR